MLRRAPVALRWTRSPFDPASRVKGLNALDWATLSLFLSTLAMPRDKIPCVARFVMQPTALHCTSACGLIISRMRGSKPPNCTILTLFVSRIVRTVSEDKIPLTAKFPNAAELALCTSESLLRSRNNSGSIVSLFTSRTSTSLAPDVAPKYYLSR